LLSYFDYRYVCCNNTYSVSFSVFNCWLLPTILLLTVELSLSEIISILKCVNNNYELFYCCSCSRPFTLHCSYFIWTAILRRAGDCCGREKLALLQLPVLVKYRIALVLVPVASDSRILSHPCSVVGLFPFSYR
jgi:hypothetical protein